MTGHFKLLAAALGLLLATGTIADVSAKTMTTPKTAHVQTIGAKTINAKTKTIKTAHRGHRLHVAKSHMVHGVRHLAGHHPARTRLVKSTRLIKSTRLVKSAVVPKTTKQAGKAPLERHAMNHHVATKATSVTR